MITVLLADDQSLVRTGFRMILDTEPDLDVVGEAEDGHQAVELAASLHPDVVLMDIRMPVMDGIDAARAIVTNGLVPVSRVLVLTTFDLDEYVYAALTAGASGFLLKDVKAAALIDAIRTVARGDALLAPSVTRRLIERFAAQAPTPNALAGARVATLTEREREVLTLIGRGHSNAEIATALFVSAATVKTHVSRVFAKLDARDRAQAVVAAYESGLITPLS